MAKAQPQDMIGMDRSALAYHRATIETWRSDIVREINNGNRVYECDIDEIAAELANFGLVLAMLGSVRQLAVELRADAKNAGGAGIVARAFADEIDRALELKR